MPEQYKGQGAKTRGGGRGAYYENHAFDHRIANLCTSDGAVRQIVLIMGCLTSRRWRMY